MYLNPLIFLPQSGKTFHLSPLKLPRIMLSVSPLFLLLLDIRDHLMLLHLPCL